MIALSGTTIFWFITAGMLVGTIFGFYLRREGVSVLTNIIGGIFSAIVMGIIGISFNLGDGLLFSVIGTLAILFLLNAFHQHHKEDIYGHVDRGIKISTSQKSK